MKRRPLPVLIASWFAALAMAILCSPAQAVTSSLTVLSQGSGSGGMIIKSFRDTVTLTSGESQWRGVQIFQQTDVGNPYDDLGSYSAPSGSYFDFTEYYGPGHTFNLYCRNTGAGTYGNNPWYSTTNIVFTDTR